MAATAVLWGSAFPAIAVALHEYSPIEITVLRIGVAALVLTLILFRRSVGPLRARDMMRMAAFGLSGMTAYQLLLYEGERSVDAGTAAMLIAASPVLVTLLGIALFGERLGTRGGVGLAGALCGALLIAASLGPGGGTLTGAALVIAAAAAQAVSFVLQKPLLARYSGAECTFYGSLFGLVPLLPFVPSTLKHVAAVDWHYTAAVTWLGIGCTVLGFWYWSRTLSATSAGRSSLALYGVPVAALAMNSALEWTVPTPMAILGGILVLVGVAFTATRKAGARREIKLDCVAARAVHPRDSLLRPVRRTNSAGGGSGQGVQGAGRPVRR
ncbi:DMT family transporter [Streptomyces sp. TRM66268-LWL]|uniref:DMT family transporter n=1 Tax=Streptomyces polyasparticus TaxID=2767826 RepID=A0ABR7SVR8_9ACTN|nr:DMT family transporter [Streptomyces polyasparticus]MBC9719614.1 DMT family transporter [Streptomyces polyasparticus]